MESHYNYKHDCNRREDNAYEMEWSRNNHIYVHIYGHHIHHDHHDHHDHHIHHDHHHNDHHGHDHNDEEDKEHKLIHIHECKEDTT